MGGARQRPVKEGHQGSKLVELGSYGGGAARGTHLDGLWAARVTGEWRAAARLLIQSLAAVAALDGGRPTTKSGKTEAV
jgi:hypothetical protein